MLGLLILAQIYLNILICLNITSHYANTGGEDKVSSFISIVINRGGPNVI